MRRRAVTLAALAALTACHEDESMGDVHGVLFGVAASTNTTNEAIQKSAFTSVELKASASSISTASTGNGTTRFRERGSCTRICATQSRECRVDHLRRTSPLGRAAVKQPPSVCLRVLS